MIIFNRELSFESVNDKISRKVLSYGGAVMIVEVHFKKGGVGEPHAHESHEQIGYIVAGRFEVTVGKATKILAAGDSFYVAPNVTHSVVALEDAVILDVFTPIRQDILKAYAAK